MDLPLDIKTRIENDFAHSDERNLVLKILSELQIEERERVIRCILFVANGDIDKLGKMEVLAKTDYRDVIMAGEYEKITDKRLRDFNEPFNT